MKTIVLSIVACAAFLGCETYPNGYDPEYGPSEKAYKRYLAMPRAELVELVGEDRAAKIRFEKPADGK